MLEDKGTPEEVDDSQRFVLALARRVAEGHKEGSFLGVGHGHHHVTSWLAAGSFSLKTCRARSATSASAMTS